MWDWGAFFHYLHNSYLLLGAGVTLALALASLAIGLVCGTVAALMRMSAKPVLSKPAQFYIWLMRGTPVLVQLIIIYTGLPQLGIRLNVIESSLLGLGLNEGAYLAEIIRAGILSVPRGQSEAAATVGLSGVRAAFLIVLPQALRVALPASGGQYQTLAKASSLAAAIGYPDVMQIVGGTVLSQTGQALEAMALVVVLYAAINLSIAFVVNLANRRLVKRHGR